MAAHAASTAPIAAPASSSGAASSSAAVAATIEINGRPCTVSHEPGVNVAAALSSTPFRDWVSGMDPALLVSHIHLQGLDMFGPRVGFLKLVASASLHGQPVPGIVFMRGGAVAILVLLHCARSTYALCCRQPRVAVGSSAFLEIPAGMLDGSGAFSGVAAKELKEETGLEIREGELIDMTGMVYGAGAPGSAVRGWYPSVGACDEFLRLMYYSKHVTAEELAELQGKATGCMEEGEVITLELVQLDKLWRLCPDGKTLAALYLYEKLRAAGEIE